MKYNSNSSGCAGNVEVCLEDNHIYFYCEVNKLNCLNLIKYIRRLNVKLQSIQNEYDTNDLNIYLHINSDGGEIFSAISVIDTILNSKIPITTIIEGCAASAATLISIVGHNRVITPNSYMLIHQLSSGFWGKMNQIEDQYNNLQNLTNLIKKFYKKYSLVPKTGKENLSNCLKHDTWWDAKKCLSYGLVDKIIE